VSQRTVRMILQWLEANPGTYKSVKDKVDALSVATKRAAAAVLHGVSADRERDKILDATKSTHADYLNVIMRSIPGYKMAEDIQKRLDAQTESERKAREESIKTWKRHSHQITTAGMRIGWLGYRLVMMGRIMTRYIMQPVNQVINLLKNWQKTMSDVAYTIGILTYTGMGSTDMLATLRDTLTKLPAAGLQIQAAFGAIEGVLATIGVALAPIVADVLIQLADAFLKVWNAVSPTLIPALEQMANSVLPTLISLIEDVGPAIIAGFVEGLQISVPLIIELMNAARPLLPLLAKLAGILLPFAPILMAVGMAFFFISPILMTIGTLVGWLAPLVGVLGTSFSSLLAPLAAIAAAVIVGITVFLLLKDIIGPIPAAIIAITAAIITGVIVFKLMGVVLGFLTGIASAACPALIGLGTAVGTAGAAAAPAIPIILALGAAALMVGAAFLLAGAGVMLAVKGIIDLAKNIDILIPLVPVLFGVAAGMLAVAAAGLVMLPSAAGVLAMSVALVALSASIVILAGALVTLTAAAKAYEAVAGTVEKVTKGVGNVIGGLGKALSSLCFRHATPMAEVFGKTLDSTKRKTVETTATINEIAGALRRVPAGEVGGVGVGGRPGGPNYTTIYSSVEIGSVSSELDLNVIPTTVDRAWGEAIRRRR